MNECVKPLPVRKVSFCDASASHYHVNNAGAVLSTIERRSPSSRRLQHEPDLRVFRGGASQDFPLQAHP